MNSDDFTKAEIELLKSFLDDTELQKVVRKCLQPKMDMLMSQTDWINSDNEKLGQMARAAMATNATIGVRFNEMGMLVTNVLGDEETPESTPAPK